MPLLILDKSDVERLLPMQKCIELMEDAFESLASGEVLLPLRPVLRIPDTRNLFALMPAYSSAINAIGAKLITVFPDNHDAGLDSHQGAVALFDGVTGTLNAVMDAAPITAIRTAAASGLATRMLAREETSTLAILGSGTQARTHADAMLAVRPFKQIVVWSRTSEHARALAAELTVRHDVSVDVAADPAVAVRSADVICTVTAAREPILQGDWLMPGCHINAVGASIPSARELDSTAVRRARVFVDSRESALNEAGDLLIPIREGVITADHVVAELGELLLGMGGGGRATEHEITLFKSLGIAIEDLAAAHYLYERARAEDAGTWVEFGGA